MRNWRETNVSYRRPKGNKGREVNGCLFVRTMQVLKAKKIDKWVKAEFIAKRFPEDYGWGVFAGIEETAELLKDLKVSVRAMKEGTIFRAFEPVIQSRKILWDLPKPQDIRKYVLKQLPHFDL